VQKLLGLNPQSFESKNSNVMLYCVALRFILREQMQVFLNLQHHFLQNFMVDTGPDAIFFQTSDYLGIGSILCMLKNVFIYRSENLDFARDLFKVVSKMLDQYWGYVFLYPVHSVYLTLDI
jgi:hypothetical protein